MSTTSTTPSTRPRTGTVLTWMEACDRAYPSDPTQSPVPSSATATCSSPTSSRLAEPDSRLFDVAANTLPESFREWAVVYAEQERVALRNLDPSQLAHKTWQEAKSTHRIMVRRFLQQAIQVQMQAASGVHTTQIAANMVTSPAKRPKISPRPVSTEQTHGQDLLVRVEEWVCEQLQRLIVASSAMQ